MYKGTRVYFRGPDTGKLYGGHVAGPAIQVKNGDSWRLFYPVAIDGVDLILPICVDRLRVLPNSVVTYKVNQ